MTDIQRLPVTLTAAGERALRGGHPWLFDGAIQRIKGEGKAGDLAIIFSHKKNKFIGAGLYDPASPIRIRVLHQGSPAQINAAFFRARCAGAMDVRKAMVGWGVGTTGYRLLHGENDGFPGLIVDVYGRVAVLKIYSPVWFPWLDVLQPELLSVTEAETLVLRLARNVVAEAESRGYADGQLLHGELAEEEVIFQEHSLKFHANPRAGHKTGFFLDHRANRKRVGELSEGKDVLDVFSYAGGFSVHALAGGAAGVTSLDVSEPALAQARANVRLNFGADERHAVLQGDAFDVLADLARSEKEYDLVIVDPPSFAKSDREVPGAIAAYRKINGLAEPLVAPGGILVAASCSARVPAGEFFKVVEGTLMRAGRKFKILEKTYHDVDHPIGFPEGAYLKTGYYRLW